MNFKARVLVLGGTSESVQTACLLAESRVEVILSRATDLKQEIPDLSGLRVIRGRLDEAGLQRVMAEHHAAAVVDCTHPYAGQISENAWKACASLGLPFFVYDRPGIQDADCDLVRVRDHDRAAAEAFSFCRRVLLTIGTGNLTPYARQARQRQGRVYARVLPEPDSLAQGLRAGLEPKDMILARGPFTVRENMVHLRKIRAGCLVTKDSGRAGGVPEKLEAARRSGVRVIMVNRPARPGDRVFNRVDELVKDLLLMISS